MFREMFLPRWLLVYGLCVPLALLVGYLLATPFAFTSYALVGLVITVLAIPVLLRWHHATLIFAWNSYVIVFFLPGQPNLGVVMAAISLCFATLSRTLHKENRALHVPSVAWPLMCITLIVLVTAGLTGGISSHALGAEAWGAKRYVGVLGAVIGYFAIVSQAIPKERAKSYAYTFILSTMTAVISDLAYAAGPKFYALFAIFSSNLAAAQASSQDTLLRFSGISFGAMGGYYFMLMRYGIRGVFDLAKPWRLMVFLGLLAASLFGGYRSVLILAFMIFLAQFYLEGLFRSRLLIGLLLVGALFGCGLVAFSERLPLSVQRSLSFLPLNLDPSAKLDAAGSLDWRIEMWKVVIPEVPKYLLLGKGFAFSGTDLYLTEEAMRRGLSFAYEGTVVSGNYHQGVLTLIIPFGIFGVIGFAWFCWAAWRVLYLNYHHGEKSLEQINRFLLAYFVTRLVFYLFFYGQFDMDLMVFTGIVGLSVSVNGGVKSPNSTEGTFVTTA